VPRSYFKQTGDEKGGVSLVRISRRKKEISSSTLTPGKVLYFFHEGEEERGEDRGEASRDTGEGVVFRSGGGRGFQGVKTEAAPSFGSQIKTKEASPLPKKRALQGTTTRPSPNSVVKESCLLLLNWKRSGKELPTRKGGRKKR